MNKEEQQSKKKRKKTKCEKQHEYIYIEQHMLPAVQLNQMPRVIFLGARLVSIANKTDIVLSLPRVCMDLQHRI